MSLSNKVWYFAYGSNLNVDQMNSRVGEWHLSKRALARNCRLEFNVHSTKWQGNTANLQQTGRFEDTVYGVVYLLTEEQFLSLARHEGVSPVGISVELEDGNEISHAKTFLWKSSNPGPRPLNRTEGRWRRVCCSTGTPSPWWTGSSATPTSRS